MTEELQADYLGRYKDTKAQICQINTFGDSSAVNTTYLGKTDRSRKDS